MRPPATLLPSVAPRRRNPCSDRCRQQATETDAGTGLNRVPYRFATVQSGSRPQHLDGSMRHTTHTAVQFAAKYQVPRKRAGFTNVSASYVELHRTGLMSSWESCGVGWECPCRATGLADLTQHESSSNPVSGRAARRVPQSVPARAPRTARPRPARVWGDAVLRHPRRPRCSVARQQSRSCCQSGTDGIDPKTAGSGIECCPHRRGRMHLCASRSRGRWGAHDRGARRSGLAHAGAKPHRFHLLARIADGAVTSGQELRHAEQSLTGRAVRPY